jgi:hypothetical protein
MLVWLYFICTVQFVHNFVRYFWDFLVENSQINLLFLWVYVAIIDWEFCSKLLAVRLLTILKRILLLHINFLLHINAEFYCKMLPDTRYTRSIIHVFFIFLSGAKFNRVNWPAKMITLPTCMGKYWSLFNAYVMIVSPHHMWEFIIISA